MPVLLTPSQHKLIKENKNVYICDVCCTYLPKFEKVTIK